MDLSLSARLALHINWMNSLLDDFKCPIWMQNLQINRNLSISWPRCWMRVEVVVEYNVITFESTSLTHIFVIRIIIIFVQCWKEPVRPRSILSLMEISIIQIPSHFTPSMLLSIPTVNLHEKKCNEISFLLCQEISSLFGWCWQSQGKHVQIDSQEKEIQWGSRLFSLCLLTRRLQKQTHYIVIQQRCFLISDWVLLTSQQITCLFQSFSGLNNLWKSNTHFPFNSDRIPHTLPFAHIIRRINSITYIHARRRCRSEGEEWKAESSQERTSNSEEVYKFVILNAKLLCCVLSHSYI